MPRHLTLIGGVWHYYRRVPREFAHVDSRRVINKSLKTDSRELAERRAKLQAAADDQRWPSLAAAAIEREESERQAATAAAEQEYEAAVKLAGRHGLAYRTAAQIAAEESVRQIRERIDKALKAGLIDQRALQALLGGVLPPAKSFRLCAETYIAANEPAWRNEKHRAQWPATLKAYVYTTMGEIDVRAIDVGLVLSCVEPIWRQKPETASRVRMRIEAVLDWAAARGYREGPNPARWKGHLDKLLPAKGKVAAARHHPALPFAELPAFIAALRGRKGTAARALEFTILTAVRSGEARGARWQEIDLARKVWTVPAARMKAGREHQVPLSAPAVKILKALISAATNVGEKNNEPPPEAFVFPGAKGGKALSDMALLAVLRDMDRSDITVHGFRSTFSDWTAEETAHPDFVREKALAHVVADKVEAAYRRGELFGKRRELMDDWAAYCCGGTGGT